MSVFKALAASEEQGDQGWRYSNSYNYNNNNNGNNNQHPSSSSHSTPQHQASFSMSTAGAGRGNSNPQGAENPCPENEARLMEELEGDSDEFDGDPEDYNFKGYPEGFEDYPEDFDQEQFEDGQGHFEGGQGYYEGNQEQFESGQEHYAYEQEDFEGNQEHYEAGHELYEGGHEHFEDGPEQYEDGQEHFEDGQGHFAGDQEHFEDDQEQFEDGQEHFEGDQEHFEDGQEHFEAGQEYFEDPHEHFQHGQEFFRDDQEHFHNDQEHRKSGRGQRLLEGNQEQFKRGQGQVKGQGNFKGVQEPFKGDQRQFKAQRHCESGQEFQGGQGQFKSQRHFEGDQEQCKSVQGQGNGQRLLEGGQEAFKTSQTQLKDQRQFESGQVQFKRVQGQFRGQRHFEDGQEHLKSAQGQFKGQKHGEGAQEHFKIVQRQFESHQKHFNANQGKIKGQRHFEVNQEHFKHGQGHFEGNQEYFKDRREHLKGQVHFTDGQDLAQVDQEHFAGSLQHFEDYPDGFDDDDDDDEFFEEEEDFEGDEEDFEFEDEHGNLLQDNQTESSSGFQNSYNKYIMNISQYNPGEEMESDFEEPSEGESEDVDQEAQHEKLSDQSREASPQKSAPPQQGKSAQQEHQMRLPLRVHENREFSPARSQGSDHAEEQQKTDQKNAGPHQRQQEQMRTGQQHQGPKPRQPVSQGITQQADQAATVQAKPRQSQVQSAGEVTVTSHNVTVSTYNHHPKNSRELLSRNQRPLLRMPNQQMNTPQQFQYQFPGQGARYVAPGQKQGARRNWHMPEKEQYSPVLQHERQQQMSSELSKVGSTVQKYKNPEEYDFRPHGSQALKQKVPQHFPKHPSHPRMQNSPHTPVRGPPPRAWHTPRGPSRGPAAVGHSSQVLIRASPKAAAQKSQVPGKQSSRVLQRSHLPHAMGRTSSPGSSSSTSPRAESEQGRGRQQQPAKQKTLGQEMQQLFNLRSQPRVIVQGGRGNQSLQENMYYSVQRHGAGHTTSKDAVLCTGPDGKKYLCTKPLQGPVGRVQPRTDPAPDRGKGGGSGSGAPEPGPTAQTDADDHRSKQEESATSSANTTSKVVPADDNATYSLVGQSSDTSTTTAAARDPMADKRAVDSLNKRIVDHFIDETMNGDMDDSFDSDMMDYDEDFDEDFEDDEEYYDEEEELEHDEVMREMEMEEMGNLSPPPLPVGVPRRSESGVGWPTPLPSVSQKKTKGEPEAGAAGVEFVSSSSQQRASNSPVFGFSPRSVPKEGAASSPGSAKDSHLPPLKPAQPSIPPHSELKEQVGGMKRPAVEDEDRRVLCTNCGHYSSNLENCERCKRTFPPDAEVFFKKRKMDTPDTVLERERTCGGGKVNPPLSNTGFVMDKKTFYGDRQSVQKGPYSDDEGDSTDSFVIRNTERTFNRLQRNGTSYPNQRKIFRGVKEPVTVTISSDEDEGPSNEERQQQQSSSKPASGKSVLAATVTTITTTTTTTTATAAATAAVPQTSTEAAQEKDEGFFCSPVVKPTSTFGMSRRNRMEDAAGRCNPRPRSPLMRFVGEGIYFNVRGIRIGSMRTSGVEVRFMTRSIAFAVISDRTQEELDFFVYVTDIKSIAFTLQPPQPVVFLNVSPGCGARLRSQLKMALDSPEFFDPGSRDPQKNMIVVIIEAMTDEPGLREMLNLYSRTLKVENFLTELDCEDANDLLVSSTPPILTNMRNHPHGDSQPCHPSPSSSDIHDNGDEDGRDGEEEEENAAMSMAGDAGMYPPEDYEGYDEYEEEEDGGPPSPYYGFIGPVEKLLTYPPAPAKGGITITNQDLFCLNEGEFLNDVILDFYLKYLFLEKLSEEDRQRTHIFSSFFFKRLTQKQARSAQDQEEVKLTLPERRHSRVKTWTRQVDIFSKDFLLIPINENAHWFLAIVCFPSLAAQEYVSFQPSPLCEPEEPAAEQDGESAESAPAPAQQSEKEEGEAEGEDKDKDSQSDIPSDSSNKEEWVLGKVITKQSALQNQSSDFKLGLRQPCILVMDSLMGPSRNSIIKILKEYLQVEWDLKKGTPHDIMTNVRGGVPNVPQQNNFSDCGVYVLQYAESFFDNPIANFALPMKLERWFPRSQVERKRVDIHDLILTLKVEVDNR